MSLNADDFDDLVFQRVSTGSIYGWELNGTGILAAGDIGFPGTVWEAADASSDFNGDGLDDIIFQNTTTGGVYVWQQNGLAISSQGFLGAPGTVWTIADGGDINGDGNDDILYRNSNTGEIYAWQQNGLTTTATSSLGVPGLQWDLVGAADLNNSGRDQLIFQNISPTGGGEIYVWQMNGFNITNTFSMGAPGVQWELHGTGDFNGDNHEDFVFQNANNGEVYIWLINNAGNGILGQGDIGNANGWSIVGTGDYNGDGKSDLAFQNDASGQVYLWYLNGTAISGTLDLGIASGWNVV